MQKDCSIFPIPNFAKREVEDFDAPSKESLKIYQELNTSAEEIEKCRLRFS